MVNSWNAGSIENLGWAGKTDLRREGWCHHPAVGRTWRAASVREFPKLHLVLLSAALLFAIVGTSQAVFAETPEPPQFRVESYLATLTLERRSTTAQVELKITYRTLNGEAISGFKYIDGEIPFRLTVTDDRGRELPSSILQQFSIWKRKPIFYQWIVWRFPTHSSETRRVTIRFMLPNAFRQTKNGNVLRLDWLGSFVDNACPPKTICGGSAAKGTVEEPVERAVYQVIFPPKFLLRVNGVVPSRHSVSFDSMGRAVLRMEQKPLREKMLQFYFMPETIPVVTARRATLRFILLALLIPILAAIGVKLVRNKATQR